MTPHQADIAVIGAGIVGIACAHALALSRHRPRVVLIDPLPPMSLTSAASGENYRNWWPHPVMTAFTDLSIGLMEELARASGNRIHLTRRGYALATRQADPDALLGQLHRGYGAEGASRIRVHGKVAGSSYRPALSADWQEAPDGVDVLHDRGLIARHFPGFDPAIATVVHVRRAGDLSGQQLGSLMLEQLRERDGHLLRGRVTGLARGARFELAVAGEDGPFTVAADTLVNAAGPHVAAVAALLGERLPVETVFQQKIAFEDSSSVIDRRQPFAIDLDGQAIDWSAEERALLADDPATRRFTAAMPGAIHCRPDGGERGRWIKLGWAYNTEPSPVAPNSWLELPLDPHFPEIVLRGAARLNPGLRAYYGRLPARRTHYGGYYTMTRENWPLIGPMKTPGAFVAGALSGYGTMAACATGALLAAWITGAPLPAFATALSLSRYDDAALMASLAASETGVL